MKVTINQLVVTKPERAKHFGCQSSVRNFAPEVGEEPAVPGPQVPQAGSIITTHLGGLGAEPPKKTASIDEPVYNRLPYARGN